MFNTFDVLILVDRLQYIYLEVLLVSLQTELVHQITQNVHNKVEYRGQNEIINKCEGKHKYCIICVYNFTSTIAFSFLIMFLYR